jgi:hypothetical protein
VYVFGKFKARLEVNRTDYIIFCVPVTTDKVWEWSELGILVQYLIVAITIVVVAVPEGLV